MTRKGRTVFDFDRYDVVCDRCNHGDHVIIRMDLVCNIAVIEVLPGRGAIGTLSGAEHLSRRICQRTSAHRNER